MDVFITALLGLAGILAAFFAPTWTERKIAQRREDKELRQARRLVAQELQQLASDLLTIARQRVGMTHESGPFLTSAEWPAHKGTLSRDLGQDDWRLVANVYTHVHQFRQLFALGPPLELSDEQVLLVVDTARRAHAARDSLVGAGEYATMVPDELVELYSSVPSASYTSAKT